MRKRCRLSIVAPVTLVMLGLAGELAPRPAMARPRSAQAVPQMVDPDDPTPPANQWAVMGGVLGSLPLPNLDRSDQYVFAGAALVIPTGRFITVPGLAAEFAPLNKRWGFVGSLAFDLPISNSVGLDLGLVVLTDQTGAHFADMLLAAGVGPGLSITVGSWTLSPSLSVFRDLKGSSAWTLAPALQLSRAL